MSLTDRPSSVLSTRLARLAAVTLLGAGLPALAVTAMSSPANAGSPTQCGPGQQTGYADPSGDQYVACVSDQPKNANRIIQFVNKGKGWTSTNVTAAAKGAPYAQEFGATDAYTTPDGNHHIDYVTNTSPHNVEELYHQGSRWFAVNIEAAAGLSVVPSGALDGYVDTNGFEHVDFVGVDNHVHELYYENGTWATTDLTKAAGAPAAGLNAVAGYIDTNGEQHVDFIATNGHVWELSYNNGWSGTDVTTTTGAPVARGNGAGFDAYVTTDGVRHIDYITGAEHVEELYNNGSWFGNDLTEAANDVSLAAGNSGLDGYTTPDAIQHVEFVDYVGTDGDVHELYYDGSSWSTTDLFDAADIAGDYTATYDVTGYATPDGIHHVEFVDTPSTANGPLVELYENYTWNVTLPG